MAEFPTLENIFEPIEGKSGTEANEQMRKWYTGTRQLPGGAPSAAISIVDDGITPTSADIIVDTEGQAPADNLQIIQTSSTHDGMIVFLRAANPDRAVTVIATGQLNGITLWNRAAQYVLSTDESLILQRDGSAWREIRVVPPLAEDSQLTLENTSMAARASQLASLYFRTAVLERGQQVLHVQDQKPLGTAGGTFTAGERQRDLNTIIENTIPGASLASNSIILPAGSYEVSAQAPAHSVAINRVSVVNADTNEALIHGSGIYTSNVYSGSVLAPVNGTITLPVQTRIAVYHRGQVTSASSGFGVDQTTLGVAFNIYTNVYIRRIA